MGEVTRRLAGILAADVVGYSRRMGADEAGTLAKLKALRREVIDPAIARTGGRLVKDTGDGVLAEFASAVEAVRCAIDVQSQMRLQPDNPMQLRIGINVGDVIVTGEDIHGDGVNVAARLEALAEPGGILVSGIVQETAAGRLDCRFEDIGEQDLKNIARKVRAFRVGVGEPERPALALPDKPSLAVLPFQNMSGDPEQEYFADGMVEDIITALSRIRWLFVIARNSSFTYKGRAVDIKQVARELGVRYVLEGSVRKAGNRVRVTGQLIDAATGAHLWADRYDRDLSDIFAVQDEITAAVAGVIEPALAEAEQQRVLRKPPDRLDAWEAYQRGLWHFHKYDKQNNDAALAFFRQAIALDAKFAAGHYGYALALHWDIWHFSVRDFAEVQGTPRAEALIAVSLDDKDAVAHAVLAHMRMWGGEWEAAIAEARVGFALNPNSAFVISMLGCVLGYGGYREEALARLQQAMRVSPHDPLAWLWQIWRATTQFFGRDFTSALETLHEVSRLRAAYLSPHQFIAASLAHLGRLSEARAVWDWTAATFPEQVQRFAQQRPPWLRPEDYALRVEGQRLAAEAPP
jgi:adenylate cyclase